MWGGPFYLTDILDKTLIDETLLNDYEVSSTPTHIRVGNTVKNIGVPQGGVSRSLRYDSSYSVTFSNRTKSQSLIIQADSFTGSKLSSFEFPVFTDQSGSFTDSSVVPNNLTAMFVAGQYPLSTFGNMFKGCLNLTELNVPPYITVLPGQSYSGSGLTNVILHGNFTDLGNRNFQGCADLSSITLPISLTNIGKYTFASSGLQNIKYNNTTHTNEQSFSNAFSGTISTDNVFTGTPFLAANNP